MCFSSVYTAYVIKKAIKEKYTLKYDEIKKNKNTRRKDK